MQAIVISKPGEIVLTPIQPKKPESGQIRVRPLVGGICGTDVHIFNGDFLGSYPVVPCHEFSAQVVECGTEVGHLEKGDCVAVDPNIRCGECTYCRHGDINLCRQYRALGVTRPGGFAQSVTLPAAQAHRFERCDPAEAALAEPLACVLYGQSRLTIDLGSPVIIWGVGAIGMLHLQVCRSLHGARVTVVDTDDNRLEQAAAMGAQHSVRADRNLNRSLGHIQPDGWPTVIEATGSVEALKHSFAHLAPGGQNLVFGVYPRDSRMTLTPFEIFANDWTIVGSFTYRYEFATAIQLIESGQLNLRPLIARTASLSEVPDVLRQMARGDVRGKTHIQITPEA